VYDPVYYDYGIIRAAEPIEDDLPVTYEGSITGVDTTQVEEVLYTSSDSGMAVVRTSPYNPRRRGIRPS
jgi:hypothetical protein